MLGKKNIEIDPMKKKQKNFLDFFLIYLFSKVAFVGQSFYQARALEKLSSNSVK